MTATGSIVPIAIDKLVALMTAALPDALVFDGPGVTDDRPELVLWVGWSDPDEDGLDSAASLNQAWPWLGHLQRADDVSINCVADAWNGDANMKAARDSVFSTVDQIATAIQQDPTLGLQASPVPGINLLVVRGITAGAYSQNQNDNGAYARLQFSVDIQGRVS